MCKRSWDQLNNYLDLDGLKTYDNLIKDYIENNSIVIMLTSANISSNPIIPKGRFGYDTTNKVLKIGDGVTAWNNLAGVTFS